MNYISITYAVKYELSFATNYKWLENDLCYNARTGRMIKQVMKNRCIGYCIDGKFYSLTRLRKHLREPEKKELHF